MLLKGSPSKVERSTVNVKSRVLNVQEELATTSHAQHKVSVFILITGVIPIPNGQLAWGRSYQSPECSMLQRLRVESSSHCDHHVIDVRLRSQPLDPSSAFNRINIFRQATR